MSRPVTLSRGRPGARIAGLVETRSSVVLALATLALGAVYVWVVTPGLPYDEPSHWSNVLFYAHHASLPILGHPGVTYEAQQGPLAYALDALLVRAAQGVGLGLDTAFRVVRLLGVVELACAVPLLAGLIERVVGNRRAALAGTAVFALNPMLLTMAASVQNDTLALLLGVLALVLAVRLLDDRPRIAPAALVGVLAGLAVLAKLTAWPIVVAIPFWLVWRRRRSALGASLAFLVAVGVLTAWWFIRNVVLYGDPTAAAGVVKLGLSYPPFHVHGLSGVGHIVEEVVTYLWLPTEYLRNSLHAPGILKTLLLALTLAVVLVGIVDRRRLRGSAVSLVVSCGIVAFLSWLLLFLGVQGSPPRLAYMAWPLWIALVALLAARLPARACLATVLSGLVILNAWVLYEGARVHTSRFGLIANTSTLPSAGRAGSDARRTA